MWPPGCLDKLSHDVIGQQPVCWWLNAAGRGSCPVTDYLLLSVIHQNCGISLKIIWHVCEKEDSQPYYKFVARCMMHDGQVPQQWDRCKLRDRDAAVSSLVVMTFC